MCNVTAEVMWVELQLAFQTSFVLTVPTLTAFASVTLLSSSFPDSRFVCVDDFCTMCIAQSLV